MNIYFACSITGGRQDETQYQKIVNALLSEGHTVPTALLASSEVMSLEKVIDPINVYQRDTQCIRESDALIAEISTPSHGVGYEIGYALNLSKPVICVHREGIPISKMITGNQDLNLHIFSYTCIEDALKFISDQLDELERQQ